MLGSGTTWNGTLNSQPLPCASRKLISRTYWPTMNSSGMSSGAKIPKIVMEVAFK